MLSAQRSTFNPHPCHHPRSHYSYRIPTHPSLISGNPRVSPLIILSHLDFLTILLALEASPAEVSPAPVEVSSAPTQQRRQVYVTSSLEPHTAKVLGK